MRISDWSSDVCSADLEQPLLQRRDVLVLVDDERPVAGAELLGHAGVLLQRTGGEQQQVAPVGGALRGLQVDVGLVDLRDAIGRASCRERVCQYVSLSVVAD